MKHEYINLYYYTNRHSVNSFLIILLNHYLSRPLNVSCALGKRGLSAIKCALMVMGESGKDIKCYGRTELQVIRNLYHLTPWWIALTQPCYIKQHSQKIIHEYEYHCFINCYLTLIKHFMKILKSKLCEWHILILGNTIIFVFLYYLLHIQIHVFINNITIITLNNNWNLI